MLNFREILARLASPLAMGVELGENGNALGTRVEVIIPIEEE